MIRPSGYYTYDNPDIRQLIEDIARATAYRCKSIAYLDHHDIAQEVRIKCLESLKHYNPERSNANIRTFLITCVNNRIRDLRRSLLYKHNIPCQKCDFFDSKHNKCVQFYNRASCTRYLKHERYVLCKLTNGHVIEITESKLVDNKSIQEQDKFVLLDFIKTYLPDDMLWMIDILVESNFDMSIFKPKERADLLFYLTSIVEEFYQEDEL